MKGDVMKAIRLRCLDCCADIPSDIRNCPESKCPLYPFRMGKDPYAERIKKNKTKENM